MVGEFFHCGVVVALNATVTTTTTVVGIIVQPWYQTYLPHTIGVLGTLLGIWIGQYVGSMRARNERLYESIYRPLLDQIGAVSDKIDKGLDLDLKGIEAIRQQGLFRLLEEKERTAVEKAYRRMQLYSRAYQSATACGREIIKHEMKRQFVGDSTCANLLKQLTQGYWPTYRFLVGDTSREWISLLDSLIQKKSPYDILAETAIISVTQNYDCIIGNDEIPEQKAKALSESALKAAEESGDFKWLWSVTKQLVEDINSLIQRLERHV
ncbi:hypothetical protein MUP05_00510 [Candidatus Bathyarchaeota archaeon]|nr:hypothetical protein [Candidatus Bathyarchaeota archaeon]